MEDKVIVTTTQGIRYRESLIAKYTAEIEEAKAHLETYFNHAVGIGEHSDIQVELDKWITKLTDSKDKLNTVTEDTVPNLKK